MCVEQARFIARNVKRESAGVNDRNSSEGNRGCRTKAIVTRRKRGRSFRRPSVDRGQRGCNEPLCRGSLARLGSERRRRELEPRFRRLLYRSCSNGRDPGRRRRQRNKQSGLPRERSFEAATFASRSRDSFATVQTGSETETSTVKSSAGRRRKSHAAARTRRAKVKESANGSGGGGGSSDQRERCTRNGAG